MTTEKSLRAVSWARALQCGAACLLVFTLTVPPGVRAEDAAPPRAPRTVEEIDAPLVGGEGATTAPPLDHLQGTASLLAYQSFQDGNWEIYLTVNDTGVTRRLTADPASDLEPKISPDLTRVVFTSKRTGNYELFRINVDGSGLVQLTNHGATDSAATWSPDGSRIAFQSNRNGNDDLFVMNADGSGLVQLTTNLDYDGEPAWSPDGSQIAFVSRRTPGNQTYYLYVMNADGNGQRLLSSLPYSSRPAWSYAGKRLLFDAYDSSSGQRLYIYDFADGSTRATGHFSAPTYRYSDVMAGAWGIGDMVFVTVVSYVPVDGQWYVQSMEVWSLDVTNSFSTNMIRSHPSGFPSWGNPDHRQPITTPWFPASPVKSWSNVEVRVTGSDQGIAGLASIEVQARRLASDAWLTVAAYCGRLEGFTWRCYVPSESSAIQVRTRGVDAYGNRETWPDDPQRWASTALFDRQLSGQVRDIRGVPLANVPISGIPSQIEAAVVTDRSGAWIAHESSPDPSYTVTASLPAATASLRSGLFQPVGGDTWNLHGDIDLISTDNVIVNPGFETPGAAWAPLNATSLGWIDAATYQTQTAFLRLGGELSYTRYYGPVDDPVSIRVGTTTVIGFNNWSVTIIVECPVGQPCHALEPLAGRLHDLGAAPDGTLGVVADELGQSNHFQLRTPAGAWLPTEPFPFPSYDSNHRLLADSNGRWHFLYTDPNGTVFITHRADGGGWSTAETVGSMPQGMAAAIDTGDVLRIVGCSDAGVTQRTWSAWSGLSSPTTVSNELCEHNAIALQIDDVGNAYAVWTHNGSVRFSRRPPTGSWGAPVALTGRTLALDGVVPGTGGRPRVAVAEGADRMQVMEVAETDDWSTLNARTRAAPTAGRPNLLMAIDLATQTLMSSDVQYDGYTKILNAYRLVDASGSVGVSQIASIPAGMSAPTLSVRYGYMIGDPADSLEVRIQASDALTPTVMTLPPQGGGAWTTQWFDAAAWAGKTVTVTVILNDVGGGTAPVADVDWVALAPWTTPAITDVSPTGLAGAGDVFTITGERFLPTTTVLVGGRAAAVTVLDAQHLSVTLPSDHAVGPQSVIVTNPGGFAAQAAPIVWVGSDRLTLPVLLRWTP